MNAEYAGLKSTLRTEGWTILGIIRFLMIVLVSVPLVFVQFLMVRFTKRHWWTFAGLWHRTACYILGVRIQTKGRMNHNGPVLYAANHVSWLDILILGGVLENASFIAKSEMAGWGLIGKLCALHKTVFVNRTRRSDTARQRDALVARVQDGHSLILFPEGTSTDGIHVGKFKSALFSVAERADEATDHKLVIQPVTIAFTEMNGMPVVRSRMPLIAWLGDVELLSHLRQFLGQARTSVTLEFHSPITLAEAGCRKALADYCEAQVRAGLERAHRLEERHGPQAVPYISGHQELQA